MVVARSKWSNTIRGILRGFGYRVTGSKPRTLPAQIAKMELPDDLRAVIQPLLDQLVAVSAGIERCEQDLQNLAEQLPEVNHLRQIPGVGLIVALYFVLTVEDPERFRDSRDVAAFFGLRPTMRSSANVSHFGRITRQGDPEMRRLLVQAAHGLLRTRTPSRLKEWTVELASKKGKSKALVAAARKLAVVMHRLWVTGETFRHYPPTVGKTKITAKKKNAA
jgi:transposase